jgi:uncharacterized protein YukE
MSAQAFAVPVGDPETLKRAAGTFGTLSSDHQGQLTAFNGQVQNALANWRGPVAEQYAVVAGDAARRFSAVVTALTAVQTALGGYASALEAAQLAIGSLNRQVAAKSGASAQNQEANSLSGQESATASTLRQAARTCEQALQAAQTALAAQCPDTMTTQQFVQVVKNAESRLNNPQKGDNPVGLYSGLEYMLTAYALFASAKGGVQGAKAGTELTESEKLLDALQTKLNPMAQKMIAQLKDPAEQARLLRGWEDVTLSVEKEVNAAKAATAIEGGSFLEGMLKAQNVEIEAEGAHAATSATSGAAALDALFRTSKIDVILAPVTIAFGIHDLIWPPGDSGWEKTGNRVAGGVGAFGGALALATWAGGLFGVTWEIPGVDIGTGVIAGAMLLAAGLWAAGDAIYDFRHQIWDGLKDAGEGTWHGLKDAGEWTWDGLKQTGESIADMPGEVVHGLEHLADPLDW